MKERLKALMVVGLAVFLVAGCATPSPRQRPVKTSPIASGPQTVEAARKALEGRWTLMSLDVSADDGRKASVDATGILNSDAFGNLSVEYRLSDAGRKTLEGLGIRPPNPVISESGQVAIDTQQRRITYLPSDAAARAFDADLAAARANPFSLERPRYYALGDDGILTLATRHDSGQDAAVSRWKKN
jgi:hypothetical protein